MNTFHSRSLLRIKRTPSIPKRTLYKSRSNKLFVPSALVKVSQSLVMQSPIPQPQDVTSPIAQKPWQSTQPDQPEADCRTVRSNYSRMSCKSKRSVKSKLDNTLNESALYFDSEAENNKFRDMSLGELEKLIDRLLRERVRILIQAKNNSIPTLATVTALHKELQLATKAIFAKTSDDTRSNMSQYRSIDAKVELVERILSQQYVEADILRIFYQLYTYAKTQYSKLGAESPLKHLQSLRQTLPSPHAKSRSFLTNTSINQESYRKIPKEEYALIHKQQKQKYRFKPQAMPSSTYKENFLNYSGVLTLKNVMKSDWRDQLPKAPFHSSVGSTYVKEFNKKIGSPIDFRELDSFKDKIKQLKLKYTHVHVKPSQEMSKTMAKLQRQYNVRPQLKPILTSSFQNQFQSNSLRDFTMKPECTFVPSAPKNSRLHNLQRSYRYSSRK